MFFKNIKALKLPGLENRRNFMRIENIFPGPGMIINRIDSSILLKKFFF